MSSLPEKDEADLSKKEVKAHKWGKVKHEWYLEERWNADRLFEEEAFSGAIHDPCCGIGTIPCSALAAGYLVSCSDIVRPHKRLGLDPDLPNFRIRNFRNETRVFDNIVCNPPFSLCNKPPYEFIEWALDHSRHKVALLLPLRWLHSRDRSIWRLKKPLKRVYHLAPRPSMPPGWVIMRGEKPGGGKEDFIWAIFDKSKKPNGKWQGLILFKDPPC